MKNNILTIAFLLCALIGFTQSQDSTSHTADKLSFRWPGYRLGDKKISRKELKNELMKFPESGKLFKKHKTKLYVGGGLLAAGVVLNSIGDSHRPFVGPRKIPTATLIAFPIMITGTVLIISSINNLKKAVKKYNQQVTVY